MRNRPHRFDIATRAQLAVAGEVVYAAQRARVDHARRRMMSISGTPHAPADARHAAAELTAALREAATSAARLLRQAQPPRIPAQGRWRHRHATRAATPAVARWSSELVRLSEIAVWLRRTTLDDLGMRIATTVRVGNYAANGPHIAGLGLDAGDLAELREPRIGVDLPTIVDGNDQGPPATAPVAASVSAPAQAA